MNKETAKSIWESIAASALLTLLLAGGYTLFALLASTLSYNISSFYINAAYAITVLVYIPVIIFLSKRWNISIANYLQTPNIQLILTVILLSITWFSIDLVLLSIQDYNNLLQGKINTFSLREIVWNSSTIIAFIHTVILGPTLEEIFFRGLLFKYLSRHLSITKAILLASFLFALVHFRFDNFLSLFLTGWLLTFLFYKKHSLVLNIIFHSVLNFIFFILTDDKVINLSELNFIHILFLLSAIIVFVSIILFLKKD